MAMYLTDEEIERLAARVVEKLQAEIEKISDVVVAKIVAAMDTPYSPPEQTEPVKTTEG